MLPFIFDGLPGLPVFSCHRRRYRRVPGDALAALTQSSIAMIATTKSPLAMAPERRRRSDGVGAVGLALSLHRSWLRPGMGNALPTEFSYYDHSVQSSKDREISPPTTHSLARPRIVLVGRRYSSPRLRRSFDRHPRPTDALHLGICRDTGAGDRRRVLR